MGFFFKKAGLKPKQARSTPSGRTKAPTTPRGRQSAEMLNRVGCQACPLNTADVLSPKMRPIIPEETLVYILGDAPSKVDDEKDEPFGGPSGKLVREQIPRRYHEFLAYDNVIRDRPEIARQPAWTEIECCRGKVVRSIEKAKPKVILGLGIAALNWVTGSSDMQGMRGRFMSVKIGNHKCWFMPTYDPFFLWKISYDKNKPLKSKLGMAFKMDIEKLFDTLEDLDEPIVDTAEDAVADILTFDGSSPKHFDQLMAILEEAANQKKVTTDLETQELRAYSAGAMLLTASITYGKWRKETTAAFAIDHPEAKWSKGQKKQILEAYKRVIMDVPRMVAHNAPFEIEWLIAHLGIDSIIHEVWEDTMMQAQIIDERKGEKHGDADSSRRTTYQALDYLCKLYFGINIKKLFKFNKKRMKDEPLGKILIYNGVDTKYTHRLHGVQSDLLIDEGIDNVFEDAKERQPTVALMQWFGIDTDQKAVLANQKRLGKEIKDIDLEINELKVIKRFKADKGLEEFNPDSTKDVLEIFKDYLKREEVHVAKSKVGVGEDTHRLSVDKTVLEQIDHPLAELILKRRNRTKLKSTYIDEILLGTGTIVYPDGKLHTSFNTTVAETGRTSSDEPNLQNWPKRNDAWVRAEVVAPKKHILIAIDYAQLEYCSTAMCTQDKIIVDSVWTGYDVHMEWATNLGKLYPDSIGGKEFLNDKDVMKKFRSKVKNKIVFPAIFGATNPSMAGYMNLPEEVIDDLMDMFWESFDGLHDWQAKVMKGYYNDGFVSTLNGRKRRYPLTRNQAINHPIQGTAAELVCDAMVRLSKKAHTTGEYFLHPILNIHDDLTFAVPDSDDMIEYALKAIYTEMLTFEKYPFINVPMGVEASIGYNWAPYHEADNPYGMQEIGKFYSNKDL